MRDHKELKMRVFPRFGGTVERAKKRLFPQFAEVFVAKLDGTRRSVAMRYKIHKDNTYTGEIVGSPYFIKDIAAVGFATIHLGGYARGAIWIGPAEKDGYRAPIRGIDAACKQMPTCPLPLKWAKGPKNASKRQAKKEAN
jgi:hypothetical protein